MQRTRHLPYILAIVVVAVALFTGCAPSAENAAASSSAAPASSASAAAVEQADYSQSRVSYLGPEGTYTQEACGVFFGGEGAYLPYEDVATSVKALFDGTVDYAVIPQENTIGGPVAEYLDEVVGHPELAVVGEVELPINQNLLAKPGVKLEDIATVYSHKQGIAQGSDWLAEHMPNAQVVEVSSTAEGARMAAEDESGASAAIGSAAAADVYGLDVAAQAIQMNDANKTRFYVLATGEPSGEAADRMAFTATGSADDLAFLLSSVKEQGLAVVAVHDRPEKTELGRYTYLVECLGGSHADFEAVQASASTFTLRYLGSFPVR